MSSITKLLRDSYELQEDQPHETAYWHLQKLREAIKMEQIKNEQESLKIEVYGIYDGIEGEVYTLFDNKKRCETEAEECGCEVKTLTLYKGERV